MRWFVLVVLAFAALGALAAPVAGGSDRRHDDDRVTVEAEKMRLQSGQVVRDAGASNGRAVVLRRGGRAFSSVRLTTPVRQVVLTARSAAAALGKRLPSWR